MLAKTADAASYSGLGLVPPVAALFVLPLLYVVPATRGWWMRHRWWLLGAQAVLTYVPFLVYGSTWVVGTTGLLGGLVLLAVSAPATWLVFGALAVADGAIRAGLVGLPAGRPGASAVVWSLVAFVDEGFALFGLARLADMVEKVHAARGELADLAISRSGCARQGACGRRSGSVSPRFPTGPGPRCRPGAVTGSTPASS
jgi:two-component system, NarL family, sensor histidine kinase DesK